MENFFKKALDKIVNEKGNDEVFDKEYKDSQSDIWTDDLEATETTRDISPLEPIIKNEELEDLIDDLDEAEDNEIYYITLKNSLPDFKKKLEDLAIDKVQSKNQEEQDFIITEIALLKKELRDAKLELKRRKEVLNENPSRIEELEQELEKYESFIEQYYDQSDNYFNN